MTYLRNLVLMAFVVSMALSLNACGKRGTPEFPPGSQYPDQYPPVEEERKLSKPQPKAGSGSPYKGGAVSPQGFPLEYPNQPSY